MSTLVCPALRNDDTLGFLAALGLLELCTTALGLDARLGWDGLGGPAILHADADSLDDLVRRLHGLTSHLRNQGRVVPAPWADLIPQRSSQAERDAMRNQFGKHVPPRDTMRMPPATAADHYRRCAEQEATGDDQSGRWLAALVSQLATDDRAQRLAPMLPQANQMTTHQQYGAFLAVVASNPRLLHEALTKWQRYGDGDIPGHKIGTGAYLDARALHDAAEGTLGRPENTSVPGATWLALMSLPLFPQAGTGRGAVGWTTGKDAVTLRWPIWTRPLDLWAVSTLLALPQVAHPNLAPDSEAELRSLGVIARCTTTRRRLPRQPGVLRQPAVEPVTQ